MDFCPSLSPSIMDSGEQNSTGNGPTVFNLHLGSRMMEVWGWGTKNHGWVSIAWLQLVGN